ncbi:WD repeat-containing protein [Reticulomyxa filosa]|uniref:WD repeat-containing protein n=1 Tax=Reticulomyxa filosa TaxID=46433 RepID=X6P1Q4_RETFI|nr:WD repeat-containing protein [Reticulomyxa filosa]|eukprot:ETO31994.1 WD repeat-containing protein [Reticulomyxa filosa]
MHNVCYFYKQQKYFEFAKVNRKNIFYDIVNEIISCDATRELCLFSKRTISLNGKDFTLQTEYLIIFVFICYNLFFRRFFKRAHRKKFFKIRLKKLKQDFFLNLCRNDQTNMKEEEKSPNMHLTSFETLASLSTPLEYTQCIAHKDEILLCGGATTLDCYSYHTIKNEYKVKLNEHCVVKLVDNNNKNTNEMILLSFGGYWKHTLVMKYISVWDDKPETKNEMGTLLKDYNQWLPLIGNRKNKIFIGRDGDDYYGMCAVTGGRNNDLLFITYSKNNISVFDLNTYQFIKHDTLPTGDNIHRHCFVSKSENEMMLFCKSTGLLITYDEDNNTFQFSNVRVCTTIRIFWQYRYVYVNDCILFFGGDSYSEYSKIEVFPNEIYKYSITENKWTKYAQNMPISLKYGVAVLSNDKLFVHILGMFNDVVMHTKTKVKRWIFEELGERDEQWAKEEKQRIDIENISKELELMKESIDATKLKEIETVVNYWIRLSSINKIGWINEFNMIILEYNLVTAFLYFKYFKPLNVFQGHLSTINSVKFSPDGTKFVSTSDDEAIKIWDVESGNNIQELKGHSDFINDAQFSPDGTMIVSCSHDKTIRLWNVQSGGEIKKLEEHTQNVTMAKFSPDGKIIVSNSSDETIRIWDIKSGQDIGISTKDFGVNIVTFSPNGQQVVVLTYNNSILIFDVTSGERTNIKCHNFYIVSSLSNGTIEIWDVTLNKIIKQFGGYSDRIYDLKYFPDKQTIIGCLGDCTIRLWDAKLGVQIQKLKSTNFIIKMTKGLTCFIKYSMLQKKLSYINSTSMKRINFINEK